MSFVYPEEVGAVLAKRWQALQSQLNPPSTRKRKACVSSVPPPFPTDDNLKLLLDTVYHASFLIQEGRQFCIRLLYLPPAHCEHISNLHGDPYRLIPACPLTVSEVLRIVPALDPFQSVLVVCADSDLPQPTGSGPLVIWGVLKLGLEWHRVVTGRESGAVAPPNCLTITSQGSGSITATTSGSVLVRLQGGRILGMPLEYIGDGSIGDFLRPAAEKLYRAVLAKLKAKRYHQSADSDEHPRQEYFRVLSNILNLAKERRHGATFLLFPDTITPHDQHLTDRINLKYVLQGVSVWDALIEESISNREYYKHLFPKKHVFLTEKQDATPDQLKKLIRWEQRQKHADEEIREYENFVASLSAIDGCVVLTTKLNVLGFGGEILAQSPSLTHVKVAHEPYGKETTDQKITFFGARHRSAFRICSSFEGCLAFVVSRDGGVNAARRVGQDVIIWEDVNMGQIDL